MPKNDTVRVGFLGVGVIAGLHLRYISNSAEAEIKAVCDDPAQADKIATKYDAKAYNDTAKIAS